MARKSRVLALAFAAGIAGCSIVEDVDGLTGGFLPGDGGASDGTSDVVETDVVDAGNLDSTINVDGSLDGASGCTASHTFCDDFDDGGLGARWDNQRTMGGSLAFDTMIARSPSRSLIVAATPNDASGPNYEVALLKNFSGGFTGIHCEFDVMTDSAAPPQTAAGFGLNVSAGSGSDYFVLWNLDQARLYEEFDPAMVEHAITLPMSGRWTRIAVELKLGVDAGPGVLTLSYDGTQIVSVPTLGQPATISGVRFELGLADGYAPLENPWKIHYDSVWCDVF